MSTARPDCAGRPARADEGSILVWALVFAVIASGMIISHSIYMAANRRQMNTRYEHVTLAHNFARSGLTDALSWYQKQATQPVTTFAPQLDPSGTPPVLDTLDPTIGLVREFEVRGSLWARYEVRKAEVADISSERGLETPGTVWDVGSRAFLYRREDASASFDEQPNRVVSTTYVRTELRGIALIPPSQSAVAVDSPGDLDLGPEATIIGGSGPGIAFPDAEVAPVLPPTGEVTGSPSLVPVVGYKSAPTAVFGMHLGQLRSMADFVVDNRDAASSASSSPPPGSGGDGGTAALWSPQSAATTSSGSTKEVWEWAKRRFAAGTGSATRVTARRLRDKCIYFDGNVTLGADQPLSGRALIVINGDFTVLDANQSSMDGVIYVTGDARIDGQFQLDGALIVKGKLTMGYGSNKVVIRHDPSILALLKKALERYRISRAIRPGWSN